METPCRNEILELHRFFVEWMTGSGGDFSRFAAVMAEDFEIVFPDGNRMNQGELLAWMRELEGALTDQEFEIRIENLQERIPAPGMFIVTYEEWQTRDGETRGRTSTAVFREKAGVPNRVEWLHVQETWLPQEDEKTAG
jgi:hypothetical protein